MEPTPREKLNTTLASLLETISQFTPETFNRVPFEGSWTAGQVVEHIRLSCSGMGDVLRQGGKPADREPDQHVAELQRVFLDYSLKMQSPEFILPAAGTYDPQALSAILAETGAELDEAARSLDLTEICTAFTFPKMGNLTRLELLWFLITHTERHTHQLQNILRHLQETAG